MAVDRAFIIALFFVIVDNISDLRRPAHCCYAD